LSGRLRIKVILQKRSLVDKKRHLAVKMSTSETANAGRERKNTHVNNIKIKPEQLKFDKINSST
jgi:hypothetical protein